MSTETKDIEKVVQSRYGAVAERGLSSEQAGVRAVAEAFGYSQRATGVDSRRSQYGPFVRQSHGVCQPAARRGGRRPGLRRRSRRVSGRGQSRADGSLDRHRHDARDAGAGAAQCSSNPAATNVEFHEATIDNLPLADASVDCVISNCVINLAPDKPAVFREIARVLKPGGRLAVSDIALKKPLPPEIGTDLMAYVGCIAGAIPIETYRAQLADAGFAPVEIIDTGADLNAYSKVENQSGCCSASPSQAATDAQPVTGVAQQVQRQRLRSQRKGVRDQAVVCDLRQAARRAISPRCWRYTRSESIE